MAEKDFPFTFDSPCQDFRKSKLKVFEEGSIELNVTKVMPGRVKFRNLSTEIISRQLCTRLYIECMN